MPKDLKPEKYELEIQPFIGENEPFTFNGKVKIYFKCLNETNKVVLHSKDLNITSTKLLYISIREVSIDAETDFLTLFTANSLKKDQNYELEIEFSGFILKTLYGFYRSSYFNKNENKTKL